MELRVYPPSVPLGRACAELILERHAADLPDLSAVAALAPDRCGRLALRDALLERAAARGRPGLLLPRIASLRPWVLEGADGGAGAGRRAELLELAGRLNRETPLTASQANPWSVADELLGLFERLSLDDAPLPDDPEGLVEELRQRYGIDADAPAQLRAEADIAHRLWRAWTRGGPGATGRYRAALLRFAAPPGAAAVYVCGYEQLARLEAACLRRLDAQAPVCIAARPGHLLPAAAMPEPAAAPAAAGPWAEALEAAFARGETHLQARAADCARRFPRSPLAGRLRLFRSGQAELHARGIDIQLRRWLRDGHRDIGLVTEDRKLARRVRALLERAGVAVRDHSGWDLSTTSAATVLEKWLACLTGGFRHQDLLDLLKSPFARPCPGLDHEAAVARLETRLRRRGLAVSSLARCRGALAAGEPDADGLALLDAVAAAAESWERLPDEPDAREYFGALGGALERLGCARLLAADGAGQKILDLLEQAAGELRGSEVRLPRAQWNLLLLRQLLEEQHYAPPARGAAAVTLLTLGQAHLCAFSRLIVAGMDRRHYPRRPSRQSCLFNDAVRESLGLPGRAARRALDLQRFRALLLAADEALLTHQTLEQDEPLLPSPWLEQLRIFHELAWREPLEDAGLAALALDERAAVTARERPAPGDFDRARPRPELPPELLPERLSAGGHQDLIDCPYRFFVHRCLRLREAEAIADDPDARHFGLYVHRCLEAFHADVPELPGPWEGPLRGREDEARELLREIGERQLERAGAGRGAGAFRARWEQTLARYVARQREVEAGRRIEALELDCERRLPGGPTLRGRIDRLDRGEAGGVVLDYKTGAKISPRELRDGERVQLPSYALLRDDVAAAEYWWLAPDDRGEALDATALEDAELRQLRDRVGARLGELYGRLRAGAALPAHGDAATCRTCAAAGVCRRAAWADSAAVEEGAQRQ